ncbi:MAG TPA: hypothetical protein VM096_18375 [Vicinamibacterales bacterium]|nr:hypothetical protein [Vicinamibacterales bacterium]
MVPDRRDIPRKLFDTGLFDLKTEQGQGAFTDAVVACLHGTDERWGHLKKGTGQSHLHRHGEDSALYLSDTDGQSQAVDFIGGAGGPNPQPGWNVDDPRYSAKDWIDPFDHRIGEEPPPPPALRMPSYGDLGDDAFFRSQIGAPLQADMLLVGQTLNEGSSVWFSRATYEILTEALKAGHVTDAAPIVRKYRNQWRAAVGLPPV